MLKGNRISKVEIQVFEIRKFQRIVNEQTNLKSGQAYLALRYSSLVGIFIVNIVNA